MNNLIQNELKSFQEKKNSFTFLRNSQGVKQY